MRRLAAGGVVVVAAALGAVLLAQVSGQSSEDFDLSWNTYEGGGGTSSGGEFLLAGAIGQAEAGPALEGETFTLVGGFLAIAMGPVTAFDYWLVAPGLTREGEE